MDALASAIQPHFGSLRFPVPPSYRAFLERHGGAKVEGDALDADDFHVFAPEEVARDTRELVHVPEGVTWEDEEGDEHEISTNHLVAFATAGPEARWCFDADGARPDGELPVYLHHQDEPTAAKDVKTGKRVAKRKPDFKTFSAWLERYVKDFCEK